jgi:ABC-type sugar transport system ATPase subunit
VVQDAVKDYPGQRALDRMSFTLEPGEIHALLGENGAGKSTLIKAVSGAIGLDEGSVTICGQDLSAERTPEAAIAAGLSVVYQHGNLVPTLSITENVLLATGLPRRGGVFVDLRRAGEAVRALLERVGLSVDPSTPVADLGPHQAAMVAIAKALAANARIIILDEPTSALLPAEVDVLFAQMRRLASEGIGFVFVTHRLAEVFQISDRITVMRDGRSVGTWRAGELDHDSLVDHLVGPEKSLAEPHTFSATSAGDVVLQVRGLTGATLHGVDLTVRSGEVLGVASLPGEGAPEVIEALFGLSRCQGEITVHGRRARLGSPRAAMKSGFALVPRDRLHQSVVPELSVADNVTLATTGKYLTDPVLRLVRRGRVSAAAQGMVDRLRVKTPSLATPISSLSGGNQQKVIIGRWLLHSASVYLLDSPTAAVDVHAKSEIYGFIRAIADQGAGVVFASTEVEEFARVCDRVIVLSGGQIVDELVGDDISVNSIMRLSFGRKSA